MYTRRIRPPFTRRCSLAWVAVALVGCHTPSGTRPAGPSPASTTVQVGYGVQDARDVNSAVSLLYATARFHLLLTGDLETAEKYVHEAEQFGPLRPRNMGGLTFVGPRLRAVVPRNVPLRHVSRPERASTAEGKHSDHVKEQDRIAREALVGKLGE